MAIVEHNCEKECPSKQYQERLYGKGRVVANERRGGGYRCTICNRDIGGASVTKKEKKKAEGDK